MGLKFKGGKVVHNFPVQAAVAEMMDGALKQAFELGFKGDGLGGLVKECSPVEADETMKKLIAAGALPPPPPKEHHYKVGDWVRIVVDEPPPWVSRKGQVGIIRQIYPPTREAAQLGPGMRLFTLHIGGSELAVATMREKEVEPVE